VKITVELPENELMEICEIIGIRKGNQVWGQVLIFDFVVSAANFCWSIWLSRTFLILAGCATCGDGGWHDNQQDLDSCNRVNGKDLAAIENQRNASTG